MSTERVPFTADGRQLAVAPRTLLIDALREHGIEVPTLCHDARLTPYGGCRLCVVARRDGRGGLVPACSTPVERGMVIETAAPDVIESRRQQLQLIALNHRMECPVCERRGDCRLQDLIYRYGTPERALPFDRPRAPRDEASPLIVRDPEKCILCGKCVRLCDEVQGVAEIGIAGRGLAAHVTTMLGAPLDCELCGQCADACPVGALVARPFDSPVPAWMRTAVTTTCTYCSCGCQVTIESHDGRALRVTAPAAAGPNHGKLCVKGRFGLDLLRAPERLSAPLVRRDGALAPATWDEALDAAAGGLRRCVEQRGVAVAIGSPRLTDEAAYLLQRLARVGLGSPQVSAGPAAGVAALVAGVAPVLGRPCSTASLADLAKAETVLVVRGDPSRSHPLVKTEIVQGVRQRGHRLVMAHSQAGWLERHAAPFLRVRPGSEAALLHGVAHLVVAAGGEAVDRCRALPGFTVWAEAIARYEPDVVAGITGIGAPMLRRLATELRESPSLVGVVVCGEGLAGDEAAAARAMAYLLLVLGRAAGPGSGLLVVGEKGNVQGIVDAGLNPDLLPGWRDAAADAARTACAAAWGASAVPGRGWSLSETTSRAARGEVDLLYLAGHDAVSAWPAALEARAAVAGARFVIVHDAFLTATAQAADVVLPVAILAEREGTSTAADGVRRALTTALPPPGGVPQDDDLLREVARRAGIALPDDRALAAEVAALSPAVAATTPVFAPVEPVTVAPAPAGMLLDVAPQLFHSGSMTAHSATLRRLAPVDAVRLSPGDAAALGAGAGDALVVTVAGREAAVRARIDRTVATGIAVISPLVGGLGGALAGTDGEVLGVQIRRQP